MSYTILPVTPTDLPDVSAICDAAFKDDPIVGHLMSNVLPEVKQAHDMHYWENQLVMSEYNGMRLKKLVDKDGYDRCRLRDWRIQLCTDSWLEKRWLLRNGSIHMHYRRSRRRRKQSSSEV